MFKKQEGDVALFMLVLGSCPMKTKITQSLDGFRLQLFTFTSPPGFDFYHLSLAAGCDLHYTFIAVRPSNHKHSRLEIR